MFVNGVSVVLAGRAENYRGMSIAWVSQAEKDHLMISVPKNAEGTAFILQHKTFSVNELVAGQEVLAGQFGGRNCKIAKSETAPKIDFTKEGLPVLNDCRKSVICACFSVNELNEQVVILAKIIRIIERSDLPAMVFNKPDYFE